MKKKIDVLDYANYILKEMRRGILITTKSNGKVNSMSIGWGTLGVEWNKNIFMILIRENRFTRTMLDENPEFTVNIAIDKSDRNIIKVCGTKSGKDTDKIKELNLTLEDSNIISVPAIKELPLTLECKVIYKQIQDSNKIPEEIRKKFYPQDVESSASGANKDFHIAYYGEIVDSYIIE